MWKILWVVDTKNNILRMELVNFKILSLMVNVMAKCLCKIHHGEEIQTVKLSMGLEYPLNNLFHITST